MEMDFCGPLPPQFGQSVQSKHGSDHDSEQSKQPKWVCSVKAPKKHLDKRKHNVQAKYILQLSSSEEEQSFVQIKKSVKPKRTPFEQDQRQTDPDPVFIGKYTCLTCPHSMQRKLKLLGML